jgi:hypothetical protein
VQESVLSKTLTDPDRATVVRFLVLSLFFLLRPGSSLDATAAVSQTSIAVVDRHGPVIHRLR